MSFEHLSFKQACSHTSTHTYRHIIPTKRRLRFHNLLLHLPPASMCTYHNLWYQHDYPCTRDGHMRPIYTYYCPNAGYDAATGIRVACAAAAPDPAYAFTATPWVIDDACAAGQCRFEDLGGCWRCCECGTGGNTQLTCRRREGDTFCYHQVCQGCIRDSSSRRRR